MTAVTRVPGTAGGSDHTPSTTCLPRHRLLLLVGGGLGLAVGTYTGLARGGAGHRFAPAEMHGLIMVLGFLGTVIALERAVAIGRRWAYAAPALSGLSVLWVLTPLPRAGAAALLAVAGAIVLATYVWLLRQRYDTPLVVMALGAAAWVAVAVLWIAGIGPIRATPLLAAVLVLTIVGERLELSRLTLPGAASRRRFLAAVALFVLGVGLTVVHRPAGLVLAGVGLLGQAAWLVRYDLARQTVRRTGVTRFAAVCMLGGYGWLVVSAVLWVAMGLGATGPLLHDALVHALFLGFVLSMVMGHAPIIMPAMLRIPLAFLHVAWVPLVLLHVSVAVRVVADLAGSFWWREWALHGNVAALAAFVVVTVVSARRGRRQGHPTPLPAAGATLDTPDAEARG